MYEILQIVPSSRPVLVELDDACIKFYVDFCNRRIMTLFKIPDLNEEAGVL